MSDRRDITLIAPYVKLAAATFDDLRDADAKADAKLGEHDAAFARFHQDLQTLSNLHQAQIDHIDGMLRRAGVSGGRNGR